MVIKQVFAAEFPFLCYFFLWTTSTKLTVKISKIFRNNMATEHSNTNFFSFFCVCFCCNTQMLSFSGVMFQLTGTEISCTHQPCIFWYCIHLLNTPLYINVFIPCHFNLSATFFSFVTEIGLMATVKKFVMQSDHSASVQVVYICVCVKYKS